MRNLKLIIGILSIVLCLVVTFQSCATGVANRLNDDTKDTSGSAGVLLAIVMLVAGITAIVTRDKKVGTIVAGFIYAIGGLIGISNKGTFGDLMVWSVLSLIFGAIFIISGIAMKKS